MRSAGPVILAALLAVALAGCSAAMMQSKNGSWDRSAHEYDLRFRGPATAPDGVATTRPEGLAAAGAAGAAEDLERSVWLICNGPDYPAARHLLMDLEGRLLLARDLDRAAQAAFWTAFCDEKLELLDKSVAEYQRLIDRYPESLQARTAGDRLNRLRPTHARVAPSS